MTWTLRHFAACLIVWSILLQLVAGGSGRALCVGCEDEGWAVAALPTPDGCCPTGSTETAPAKPAEKLPHLASHGGDCSCILVPLPDHPTLRSLPCHDVRDDAFLAAAMLCTTLTAELLPAELSWARTAPPPSPPAPPPLARFTVLVI